MSGKYPRVTAGGLIFNKEGEFLLVQSHKWSNKWLLPSGKVKYGEKLKDTLRREMKEETNLEITDIKFYFFGEMIKPLEYYEPDNHFICFNFICQAVNEKELKLNEEAENWAWVNFSQAKNKDLEGLTRKSLLNYFKNQAKGKPCQN